MKLINNFYSEVIVTDSLIISLLHALYKQLDSHTHLVVQICNIIEVFILFNSKTVYKRYPKHQSTIIKDVIIKIFENFKENPKAEPINIMHYKINVLTFIVVSLCQSISLDKISIRNSLISFISMIIFLNISRHIWIIPFFKYMTFSFLIQMIASITRR